MKINFTNKTGKSTTLYRQIIRKVFDEIKSEFFFNLIFITKDEIQEINKNYRGIDRVTDVITFSLLENTDEIFSGFEYELGDIFICVDRAIEQAKEYGHSIEREIAFLAVHGYLHLKGYDHQTEEEEKEMFDLQEEILNNAGFYRGE